MNSTKTGKNIQEKHLVKTQGFNFFFGNVVRWQLGERNDRLKTISRNRALHIKTYNVEQNIHTIPLPPPISPYLSF